MLPDQALANSQLFTVINDIISKIILRKKQQRKTGWKDERNRKTVSIITRKIESTKRNENEQGTIRVRGEKG